MSIVGTLKHCNMYKVYDSLGNLMRKFSTYQAAATYKLAFGNIYWTIK